MVNAFILLNNPLNPAFYNLTGIAINFSHRIDLLAFGVAAPNVINPLDGVEFVTKISKDYYIEV